MNMQLHRHSTISNLTEGSYFFPHRVQELYHELHALDRFEQDYKRKHHEEDNSNAAQRG